MDHGTLTALAPTIKELGLEKNILFIGLRPTFPANVSKRNIYTREIKELYIERDINKKINQLETKHKLNQAKLSLNQELSKNKVKELEGQSRYKQKKN